MTIKTDAPLTAKVGFGAHDVGLYFLPEGEHFLRRHLALEMPRDPKLGEADVNVRYLRRIETAANSAERDS